MRALRVETRREQGQVVPLRFGLEGAPREVAEVVDRWPGDGYEYLRVRTTDAEIYILRHDEREDSWEIVVFEAP